ncbi:MAG TPA: DUF3999 family protein [Mucilaginibacter sp.]|nr:DUF3999 family protein [Mucilaginibacter sp.]
MIKISREKKRVFSLLVLLLFTGVFAWGQENKFKYRADVYKIDSNAVYRIFLQPGFIAKSVVKGLYDVRLADENGKFIAYSIVDRETDRRSIFMPFPEVKSNQKSDTATVFIADAHSKSDISELWIRLKSNEVMRMASLSGSDDLQHWFAIKEGIELDGDQSGNDTEYEQQLKFPASKYRYYRVRINNKNNDPLQITGAGIYILSGHVPLIVSATQTLKPKVQQGNKQTSYFIDLGDDHQVDELILHVTSPKYYTRNIRVYDVSHKGEDVLTTGSIKSGDPDTLYFSAKTNRIRIDVENGDDSPIVISGVEVFQLARSAVAYLEKGHQYHLLTGDSTASEVSYDLTFLHSKPMSKFPSTIESPVYKNPAYAELVFKVKRDYTQLIWISIAVVLILLSLLTWRMVKELNTKPRG